VLTVRRPACLEAMHSRESDLKLKLDEREQSIAFPRTLRVGPDTRYCCELRGRCDRSSYFPPVGQRRRSSSKKFTKTVMLVMGFDSRASSVSRMTAKRLPSGARS
jgi:hypothetical protein